MDTVEQSDESQRTRILRIAAQLFAQRGYHGVGMTELQDAVQLGRGALYHHIESKEDLLYDISKEYILDLVNIGQDLSRISEPFRPYDPIVLKGMLGMYFYSYLWMRPEGPLGPEMIAERFHELALRMVLMGAPPSINVPPLSPVTA